MSDLRTPKTEIIAISSGKGGTGKTIIAACLGYALTRAGHKVLMIDADPGTDGLSLFILGPDGMDAINDIDTRNTFRGLIEYSRETPKPEDGSKYFQPNLINRKHDHGIIYHAVLSGIGIYGDKDDPGEDPIVPRVERQVFEAAVKSLFEVLHDTHEFDYVLVDTRGGFAFESTYICGMADSFIVVTEPSYTNFYQDRNLMKRIDKIVQGHEKKPFLRAIIVNKAMKGGEENFRSQLEREFPVKFGETYPVPLDPEVLKAYRIQQMPYLEVPKSEFCSSTLQAFSRIMRLVTGVWKEERIDEWNKLVKEVSEAYKTRRTWRSLILDRLYAYPYTFALVNALMIFFLVYTLLLPKFINGQLVFMTETGAMVPYRGAILKTYHDGRILKFKTNEDGFWSIPYFSVLPRGSQVQVYLEDEAAWFVVYINPSIIWFRQSVLINVTSTPPQLRIQ